MFCMLIRVYDINFVEIQFNHSKHSNFIGSWKMVKSTIKIYKGIFLHKTSKKKKKKKKQRKPGVKRSVYSWVWRHLSWIQNFVTTVFSPISGHCWCKNKKLSSNWRCPPFGKFFKVGLNFENKAFFCIYKV